MLNKENKDNNKESLGGVVCDIEFENKDIYDHFSESGFGTLNLTLMKILDEDIEIYGKSWVREAINEAVRNGKYKISYVEGIILPMIRSPKTLNQRLMSTLRAALGILFTLVARGITTD